MSERFHSITVTVNGEKLRERVDARKTLVDFLREDLSLTGSHVGCEHGVCGACTVRVDGEIVRGCLMLAVQCDGARVDTIEGVSDQGEITDSQPAGRPIAHRSASISPAITVAAPVITRSLMRLRRWRSGGREVANERATFGG